MIAEKIVNGEEFVMCETLEDLKAFAVEGGWESLEEMVKDAGVPAEEMLYCWFTVVDGRFFWS